MASEVSICNQAILHLGSGKTIGALTERSLEAQVCSTFFEDCRDIVLRDFPWPFAAKVLALGLVEEDPNTDWAYSYRYPSDCIHDIKIMGADRIDDASTRIEYEIGGDTIGSLVFTDEPDAYLKYTRRLTDPSRFPPDFTEALGYLLASKIGPQLTGSDPMKMAASAGQKYMMCLSKAKASAANEGQVGLPADSSFITGR